VNTTESSLPGTARIALVAGLETFGLHRVLGWARARPVQGGIAPSRGGATGLALALSRPGGAVAKPAWMMTAGTFSR